MYEGFVPRVYHLLAVRQSGDGRSELLHGAPENVARRRRIRHVAVLHASIVLLPPLPDIAWNGNHWINSIIAESRSSFLLIVRGHLLLVVSNEGFTRMTKNDTSATVHISQLRQDLLDNNIRIIGRQIVENDHRQPGPIRITLTMLLDIELQLPSICMSNCLFAA